MAEAPVLSSVLSFQKLNSDNWRRWRFHIEMLLCHEGLWGFIDGTEPTSPPEVAATTKDELPAGVTTVSRREADYNRRKQKAASTIALAIEPQQQNLIMGLHDPKQMWEVLKSAFEPSSRARIAHLRSEFMKLKFDPSETMAVFISRLKQAADRLTSVGKAVDDDQLAYQMLMSLPPEFDNVVQQLYMLKDDQFTSAAVEERLLAEYDRLKHQKAVSIDGGDYSRGENVLLSRRSKNRNRSQKPKVSGSDGNGETRKCFRCGIIGHISPQCKVPKKKMQKGKPFDTNCSYAMMENPVSLLSKASECLDWIVDSGSSNHFICDKYLLRNFKSCDIEVKGIGDSVVKAEGYGSISLCLNVNGHYEMLTLLKVYWGPTLKKNLISGSQIDRHGHRLVICDSKCKLINSSGRVMGIAPLVGSLYILRSKVISEESPANAFVCKSNDIRNNIMMWHRRFGHQNMKSLKHLAKENLVFGLNKLSGDTQFCDPCVKAKMTRAQFKSTGDRKTKRPLELIHLDVWSSASGPSFGQAKYLLSAVDDFSRFAWIFTLKNKSDCFEKFKTFQSQVENQLNKRIKAVRTDNGLEFCSQQFEAYLKKQGIIPQRTNAYSPEMNGVAERLNRTLADGVRAIRIEAELPKGMWAELAHAFIYLYNRFPHRSINNQIPFTMLFGRKCSVRHLKVIGSLAYVHVEKFRRDKMDPKTKEGVLVGYAFNTIGYRIWLLRERRIIETKHVKFNELVKGYTMHDLLNSNSHFFPQLDNSIDDNDEPEEAPVTPTVSSDVTSDKIHCSTVAWRRVARERTKGKSKGRVDVYYYPPSSNIRLRGAKKVKEYCDGHNIDYDEKYFDYKSPDPNAVDDPSSPEESDASPTSFLCIVEPSSFEEAVSVPEATQWKHAMDDELNTLKERNVYELVSRPLNKKVIGSRWVYKIKENGHHHAKVFKARIVAQGYRQVFGIDYDQVFTPVVNFEVIYMFISLLVLSLKWFHRHLDVKCAYLYGQLDREHFMETPKGFVFPSGTARVSHVFKLNKALYGLHQAGRQWHSELESTLISLGFSPFQKTNCIYHLNFETIILVYVDDLIVFSKTESQLNRVINLIKSKFEIKDLGKIRKILGIEFKNEKDEWVIHQKMYIERLKIKFQDIPFVNSSLPMSPGQIIKSGVEEPSVEGKFPYRQLIGSLLFLATRSRPDILFSVTMLAQYNSHPTLTHWHLLCQVFNYVITTIDFYIPMLIDNSKHLSVFTDASWASDRDNRRSFSGFIIFFKNIPISWKTRKQKCVALSSMEAEYIALSEACKELIWFSKIYEESASILTLTVKIPLVYCDSESAIYYCKNNIENVRNKHIDIRFHFVKQFLNEGLFQLLKVPGKWNVADVLTKPVTKDKLKIFFNYLFRWMEKGGNCWE